MTTAARVFEVMWEGEKRSVAAYAAMWEQRDLLRAQVDRLRPALLAAKEKLALYRAAHGGEYLGGVEYSELMRRIDEALK